MNTTKIKSILVLVLLLLAGPKFSNADDVGGRPPLSPKAKYTIAKQKAQAQINGVRNSITGATDLYNWMLPFLSEENQQHVIFLLESAGDFLQQAQTAYGNGLQSARTAKLWDDVADLFQQNGDLQNEAITRETADNWWTIATGHMNEAIAKCEKADREIGYAIQIILDPPGF